MRKQSGVTLIELVTVMSIAAVLATVGFFVVRSYLWKTRAEEARYMLHGMKLMADPFFAQNRYLPNNPWVFGSTFGFTQQTWPSPTSPSVAGFETIGFKPASQQLWHDYEMLYCADVSQAPCTVGPCHWGTQGCFPAGGGVPGYILRADGDVNKDGTHGQYCITSQAPHLILWAEDYPGQSQEFF